MKANQAFRNADEAVSPVIGVILMVAITVVLAAVVFVLVSNLSKTSDKGEDAAFKADSPVAGQLHITMIKQGANGPYSIDNSDPAVIADDVFVTMDGQTCDVKVDLPADEEEFFSLSGFPAETTVVGPPAGTATASASGEAALWGAGEVMIFNSDCSATAATTGVTTTRGPALASSTEHRVQVTVRGTLLFEGNVIIR